MLWTPGLPGLGEEGAGHSTRAGVSGTEGNDFGIRAGTVSKGPSKLNVTGCPLPPSHWAPLQAAASASHSQDAAPQGLP